MQTPARASKLFVSLVAVVAAGMLIVAPSVEADPPPWAPAHGYRAKHPGKGKHKQKFKHTGASYEAAEYNQHTHDLDIPRGRCNREVLGGLLGGAIGGTIGSQVGKGDGKVAAAAVGSVIGYIIGAAIGRSMDQLDEQCIGQVLERAADRQTVAWVNPNTQSRFEVTPTRTFQRDGQYCRDYRLDAVLDGIARNRDGTACRQNDGGWITLR